MKSDTDRHAYFLQHTDQMLGLATIPSNKTMKSRLHYSTSKVYCPFWSLKRWHLHVHKETACKEELWFRGAPRLHWTHTGSRGETSVTSLFSPGLPPMDSTVQIKRITLFQFGSKILYVIQENTNLISNYWNNPFCDHFSSLGQNCSSDGAFVRFWEQETLL